MCRSKSRGSGRRCSHGAFLRFKRAVERNKEIQKEVNDHKDRFGDKPLPKRLAIQSLKMRERMHQATKIYYSSHAGRQDLQNQYNNLVTEADRVKRNKKKGSSKTADKIMKRAKSIQRELDKHTKIAQTQTKSTKILESKVTYADGTEVVDVSLSPNGTKNRVLDEKMAITMMRHFSGDPVNMQAQKASPEYAEDHKDLSKVKNLVIPSWRDGGEKESFVRENARDWVDGETGWDKSNARPNIKGGTGVGEPQTKFMRINSPDGTIVETKLDAQVIKTKDGYVPVVKKTVAVAFMNTSPIDKTGMKRGVLMNKNVGVISRHEQVNEPVVYATEEEALRALNGQKAKATKNIAAETVLEARERTVHYAANFTKRKGMTTYRQEVGEKHLYDEAPSDINKRIDADRKAYEKSQQLKKQQEAEKKAADKAAKSSKKSKVAQAATA